MAHAPSVLYLTQRWMRRHRAAAVAALTCFVAIITGSSVAVWQAVRATQAQHAAERQLADAEAATKLMTDTLASLPSYGQDQMIRRSDLMKGVVQRVMEFKGEPRRKLRLLDTLAKAVRPLDAIPLQEEVLRLGEALYLPDAPELWSLRYDLAKNKAAFSELRAEAMPELRRIYERHREHLGDKHETTMHMALTFARNLIFMGEEKDGVPMLQELIRYSDAHPKAQPAGDRVFYRLDCARGLSQMGRVDEALEMGRDNLRIALQELGDSDFEAARAFQSHGEICLEHEFFQEAEDTLKKAVGMFHRSVGPLDPISEQTVQTLAEYYQEQGMKDKLIDLNRTVLRMHEEKAGMAHIATANRVRWLAQALIHAGRMEEADQETSEWLQRVRLPGGKLPASGESILRGHVDVLRSRADWPRAEAEMREIVGILQAGRPKDPLLWEDQSNLAEMIIQQGRLAEARPLLEEVIAKYEKSKPEPGSRSEMLMRLAKDRLKRAQ